MVRIVKEVNPAFSNPEAERLLELLRKNGYLDSTQRLTAKALEDLEQVVEIQKSIAPDLPDNVLEDYQTGLSVPEIAQKNGVNSVAIEKRLERALEKGELEPNQCISLPRLEQVRLVADEIGFSPLAKLSAALPKFSKLELKAARLLLE